MRRKTSIFIALIGVVTMLGINPAAQATHDGDAKPKKDVGKHEGMPTPPRPTITAQDVVANCSVNGLVSIGNSNSQVATGGIPTAPGDRNHNHYRFRHEQIICNSTNYPAFSNLAPFRADAAGGTDGPADPSPTTTHHGESATLGWSHGDCYAGRCTSYWGNKKLTFTDLYDGLNVNPAGSNQCTNCGEISVANLAGTLVYGGSANWVKFVRTGTNLVTWGALVKTVDPGPPMPPPAVVCFVAKLAVTWENPPPPGLPKSKIDSVRLTGDATLWDAHGTKANCVGEKGHKP